MSKKPNISIQFEQEPLLFPPILVQQRFNQCAKHYNNDNAIGEEIAKRLTDRLDDLKRPFHTVLDLGAGTGTVANLVQQSQSNCNIVTLDFAHNMLEQSPHLNVLANTEGALPFADETFDLVISNFCLPFINDIPKFLHSAGKVLKKDGLFMATTLGLESFREFKKSAEAVGLTGMRTFPLPDIQSVGAAVQRIGFALPVIDRDVIQVSYPSLQDFYQELKALGATNIHPQRPKGCTPPKKWQAMEEHYLKNYSTADGEILVTLEVIYIHGFRPHQSQPKALKPGTGQKSLAQTLKAT